MSPQLEENEMDGAASDESPGFDFLQYWSILQRRSRLLVSIAAVVLLLTVIRTLLTPSTYRASTLLSVEKDTPSQLDFGQSSVFSTPWDPEYYQTQYDLLKSRGLAERVVAKLRLVERPDFNPARASFWKASPSKASPAGSAADDDLLAGPATLVQFMTAVKPIRGTHLVTIEVVAPSPRLAADLANGLAEAFIDWTMENRFGKTSDAARYLAAQAEQLKVELEAKKKQLSAYGAVSNIVSADPQGNLTMQKLESISRDYATALADRITKEARYNEVRTAPPTSIADTLSNGLVMQLRTEQAKAEREYAQKLSVFKPEWPAMQQLAAQIEKGKEHLRSVIEETVQKARASAKADYEAALQREQSLLSILDLQKQQAVNQTSESAEYNNLRGEVQVKQSLVDALLKRQGETSVDSDLMGRKSSGVRIVDRALVPGARFRPSLPRNLLLGGFLGLALALATVLLLDHLDRSLKSAEDVERWIGLPTLGVIPSMSEDQKTGLLYGYGPRQSSRRQPQAPTPAPSSAAPEDHVEGVPIDRPRSSAAEAYRSVRTALLLSSAERLQTFLVTSALPGEGKTATAFNLALVLAQLGKSVVLIDGDMRHPRVHEVLRISNRLGLVSYLTGQVRMAEVGFKTNIPNLYVVPAGPTPPNPAELLSSARMASFLEAARTTHEYIVIDTPPLMLVTDAVVTGTLCDGAVLCAHGGKTPRDVVRRAREILGRSGLRVYGVLLNNLPARYSVARYYGGADYKGHYARYYVEDEAPSGRAGGKGQPA